MKNLSTFQIIILAAFIAAALIGVGLFSLGKFGGGEQTIGRVVIWGTVDERIIITALVAAQNVTETDLRGIQYIQKNEETFDRELVEALAAGNGPDMFLLEQSDILTHRNKVFPISYDAYSERRFKDTFIEEGELYLFPEGIIGIPFLVDPLVMYWNRDILASEGIALPPETWSQFFILAPQLSRQTADRSITRSTVALGEFDNITSAKDLIAALILQAGSPIVVHEQERLAARLNMRPQGVAMVPAESALRFYTEFSNPVKSVYSWNRALPSSQQAFLSGDLVFYFGYASELPFLRSANPNLNFDVELLPQVDTAQTRRTFGHMYAFAITRQSTNKAGALTTIGLLTSVPALAAVAGEAVYPPVLRTLLEEAPQDQFRSVFYRSALIADAWLDPNDSETNTLFREMIRAITSGRLRVSEAIADTQAQLELLLGGG